MAHQWDYIELMGYISAGLGAFRVLSQFVIKMIAIFAREEFSERAFQVLKISSMERAARVLHRHTDNDQLTQNTGSAEVRRRSKRRLRLGSITPVIRLPRLAPDGIVQVRCRLTVAVEGRRL